MVPSQFCVAFLSLSFTLPSPFLSSLLSFFDKINKIINISSSSASFHHPQYHHSALSASLVGIKLKWVCFPLFLFISEHYLKKEKPKSNEAKEKTQFEQINKQEKNTSLPIPTTILTLTLFLLTHSLDTINYYYHTYYYHDHYYFYYFSIIDHHHHRSLSSLLLLYGGHSQERTDLFYQEQRDDCVRADPQIGRQPAAHESHRTVIAQSLSHTIENATVVLTCVVGEITSFDHIHCYNEREKKRKEVVRERAFAIPKS
jgi:hypothetical protein